MCPVFMTPVANASAEEEKERESLRLTDDTQNPYTRFFLSLIVLSQTVTSFQKPVCFRVTIG